ncbi:LysR family transcriptional regulator [Methylocaldum sp.]|uniref:LysR family transcriptional regulator n=1 Tax=Methylocaldum sp. TaxID=1969727 RepID=UPI002D51B5B2|nr:LysR family transcriptional regulator [Methylocaldum sp.]HYE36465.1 LysR family transcriptional regulator [Methylocaldum sp.]
MIDNINEIDFRKADLNLLPVFSALLKERSVTRAASRLYLGQPAVSAALVRLREMFKDELFVRTAKGMEPTARALELAEQLAPALEIIHREMFGAPRFDPATAERTFRLGMPDSIEVGLSPSLIECIQREAPGVRVAIRLAGHEQGAKLLDNKEMDLGISRFTNVASWHRQENLYREGYVCLFDGARLGIQAPIGMEDYLALPHLLMSFSGDFEGVVDEALARRKLRRRVLFSTTRFSALPFILKETDAIATLPASMARRCAKAFNLTLSPTPIEIETFTISMLWHARHDRDPGHIWLREAVKSIVQLQASPVVESPHQGPNARSRAEE